MGQTVASDSFVQQLRLALLHLYDAPELRRSPLVELFDLTQREDPPTSLRHLLLAAIGSLKPGPGVPPQASAWRIYQILTLRYAEQVSQREVGAELCLSIRQLRRQESLAVRTLADSLWSRHDLGSRVDRLPNPPLPAGTADEQDTAVESGTPSREQEMEWLRRSFPSEVTDPGELIQAVLKIAAPLAKTAGVCLECSVLTGLPSLSAQQEAVRQALLNTLTAAIHCAPGGAVHLSVDGSRHAVQVRIYPQSGAPAMPIPPRDRESLEMAGQLMALSGGTLVLETPVEPGRTFAACLTLPAAQRINVMVVDDNEDTLDLVQRYLEGTRYHAISVRDPRQVLAAAANDPTPDVIVLDVMLPGVDGWEMLGRLREHPRTGHVPVIVCTILPQEDLALALGAAAFLRKPVSRQALLAALDTQTRGN